MKRLLCFSLIAIFMAGCARNYYNIPTENFAAKVKVLGVAPFFVDPNSDINYPQKDLLIQLVNDLNRKYAPQLGRKLKTIGNFDTVRLLDNESDQLLGSLLFRSEKRDDAAIRYNKYFWKNDELRAYLNKNNLDALMLVTVSGLTKNEVIYSRDLFKSLEADYNYLTMSAQILDANGTVLWEYPNFRKHFLSYAPLINLQYPDFSESDANLLKSTEVKFKTIDGIRRTLEKKRKDWLLRETTEPESYGAQFDEIISLLKYDQSKTPKNKLTTTELPPLRPADSFTSKEIQPIVEQVQTPAGFIPTLPQNNAEPATPTHLPAEAPAANTNEIVPATDTTR